MSVVGPHHRVPHRVEHRVEVVAAPGGAPGDPEGRLDPEVRAWLDANPVYSTPLETLEPEILALARGPVGSPPTRDLAEVTDTEVAGVAVRVYRPAGTGPGSIAYFHGGGYCVGSIGLMDHVARELAHHAGVAVVSVEYRLAPEHPYPAGLDDCDSVTAALLTRGDGPVAVAGESAGGTLAAAVALRRRDAGGPVPVAQVLIYPGAGGNTPFPSRAEFDGLVISAAAGDAYWRAYSGGRDLAGEPGAAPLAAPSLTGLPPALVVLGGCDMLRDEGRAYAARLAEAGVPVDEVTYAGQPHGFVNFRLPAADLAHVRTGAWLRQRFAAAG